MRTAGVIVVIVFTCAAALAQPRPSAGKSTADRKSPTTALLLSLGGTLAAGGLLAYGLADVDKRGNAVALGGLTGVFAPSFGEWYAGTGLTAGLGLRTAGLTLTAAGFVYAVRDCDCGGGWGIAAIGGAVFVAGTVTDIVMAPATARKWNAANLQVAPTVMPNGAAGVALAGAF
jgi:hypothetical protein